MQACPGLGSEAGVPPSDVLNGLGVRREAGVKQRPTEQLCSRRIFSWNGMAQPQTAGHAWRMTLTLPKAMAASHFKVRNQNHPPMFSGTSTVLGAEAELLSYCRQGETCTTLPTSGTAKPHPGSTASQASYGSTQDGQSTEGPQEPRHHSPRAKGSRGSSGWVQGSPPRLTGPLIPLPSLSALDHSLPVLASYTWLCGCRKTPRSSKVASWAQGRGCAALLLAWPWLRVGAACSARSAASWPPRRGGSPV